jgi:hypothetical protein
VDEGLFMITSYGIDFILLGKGMRQLCLLQDLERVRLIPEVDLGFDCGPRAGQPYGEILSLEEGRKTQLELSGSQQWERNGHISCH